MDKKSVLVVDDSQTMVKILVNSLNAMGLTVDFTTSAKEGLTKIKTKPFDLLILDLEMPEMNGVQFLNEMKQNQIKTPVIVLTGKTDDRLIVGIMSQFPNVKKYEIKPYNKESLENNVKSILKI